MKKRGISAIVATVLIIMIVIAGIGILYGGVLPLIEGIGELEYSGVDLGVSLEGYTVYDPYTNYVYVQIKRGADEVKLSGIQVIFNIEGNSVSYEISESEVLEPNSRKVYAFDLTMAGASSAPDSVSVSPIVRQDGEEIIGSTSGAVEIPGEYQASFKFSQAVTDSASSSTATSCIGSCLGSELITDGEFEDASEWYQTDYKTLDSKDYGWTVADGSASIGGGEDTDYGILKQNISEIKAGSTYEIEFTLDSSCNDAWINVLIGSVNGSLIQFNSGTYEVEITAAESDTYLGFRADINSNCNNRLDDVSVRGVLD